MARRREREKKEKIEKRERETRDSREVIYRKLPVRRVALSIRQSRVRSRQRHVRSLHERANKSRGSSRRWLLLLLTYCQDARENRREKEDASLEAARARRVYLPRLIGT